MSDVRVIEGDCVEVARALLTEGVQVDAIVTDPPYHLTSIVRRFGAQNAAPAKDRDGLYARASKGFMGQTWDGGDVAFRRETWEALGALLKPGGHLFSFSATRTYHRMASAIDDAGFEIRDMAAWLYGMGFPKSHDVSKAIDKAAGHWRGRRGEILEQSVGQVAKGTEFARCDKGEPVTAAAAWNGWGTALKPALEPICLARKPLIGTVAENVLAHGTGALNIDACRVGFRDERALSRNAVGGIGAGHKGCMGTVIDGGEGRWPANVLHDGSEEVETAFPQSAGQQGDVRGTEPSGVTADIYGPFAGRVPSAARRDNGSAARFFFSAKAGAEDRLGSRHPTVKPIALMRWLIRLTVRRGGLVLDPFAGSGTTGIAALAEGANAILIEREAAYIADIRTRLANAKGEGEHSLKLKARNRKSGSHGPLFSQD